MTRNIVVVRAAPRNKTVHNVFWKIFKLTRKRKLNRRKLNG